MQQNPYMSYLSSPYGSYYGSQYPMMGGMGGGMGGPMMGAGPQGCGECQVGIQRCLTFVFYFID